MKLFNWNKKENIDKNTSSELQKKERNDEAIIKELAIAETYGDGTAQCVFFIDDRSDYTDVAMAKCRPLENISQGSVIFDSKINVGIFKTDHTIDWGD